MKKSELVAIMAEKADLKKVEAEKALNAFVDAVTEALTKGDKISLVGFGSFETKKRAARKGKNPQTGAEINIAASTVPTFKAGRGLKDAVNK
ncbi:MAG: HU family DNA-binding protein [Clostridia bacterium]|nr:HU family DNA-binding protein [Clostridia bacterium]